MEEDLEEFFKFLKVANNACIEKGKIYKFECPICKGIAKATKSNYNGHLHAECKKCEMRIHQ